MIQDVGRLMQIMAQMTAHPLDEEAREGSNIRLAETLPFFERVKATVQFDELLEVGPGFGLDAAWWADQGKRVTALDVAPPVQLLQSGAEHHFAVFSGDMHNLPFLASTVDCVLNKHTLEHTLLPLVAIEETRRVLRDGGYFMLIVPPGHAEALAGHFIPGWNEQQLAYLMAVCGFKVLFTETHGWSACVLGQKVSACYNGDDFNTIKDRWER